MSNAELPSDRLPITEDDKKRKSLEHRRKLYAEKAKMISPEKRNQLLARRRQRYAEHKKRKLALLEKSDGGACSEKHQFITKETSTKKVPFGYVETGVWCAPSKEPLLHVPPPCSNAQTEALSNMYNIGQAIAQEIHSDFVQASVNNNALQPKGIHMLAILILRIISKQMMRSKDLRTKHLQLQNSSLHYFTFLTDFVVPND